MPDHAQDSLTPVVTPAGQGSVPTRLRRRSILAVGAVVVAVLLLAVFGRAIYQRKPEQTSNAMRGSQTAQNPVSLSAAAPVSARDLEDAQTAQKSLDQLLSRARSIVTSNSGNADIVFKDAISAQSSAAHALRVDNPAQALTQYRAASAETRSALNSFIDDLINKYALIAQKKMNENDLQMAQAALGKAKSLRQLRSELQ